MKLDDNTKYEVLGNQTLKIKCQHGKIVTINLEIDPSFDWGDGHHIEIVGCKECANENNLYGKEIHMKLKVLENSEDEDY